MGGGSAPELEFCACTSWWYGLEVLGSIPTASDDTKYSSMAYSKWGNVHVGNMYAHGKAKRTWFANGSLLESTFDNGQVD